MTSENQLLLHVPEKVMKQLKKKCVEYGFVFSHRSAKEGEPRRSYLIIAILEQLFRQERKEKRAGAKRSTLDKLIRKALPQD